MLSYLVLDRISVEVCVPLSPCILIEVPDVLDCLNHMSVVSIVLRPMTVCYNCLGLFVKKPARYGAVPSNMVLLNHSVVWVAIQCYSRWWETMAIVRLVILCMSLQTNYSDSP